MARTWSGEGEGKKGRDKQRTRRSYENSSKKTLREAKRRGWLVLRGEKLVSWEVSSLKGIIPKNQMSKGPSSVYRGTLLGGGG